jgi:hypothetical protein
VATFNPPWDLYLAVQTRLGKSTVVDDTSWDVEAQLDRIVIDRNASTEAIKRHGRAAGRRERYQAALRRRHLSNNRVAGTDNAAQARRELQLLKAFLADHEWNLISAVAVGNSYDEIAVASGVGAGALRVRVERIRRKVSRRLACVQIDATHADVARCCADKERWSG